MNPEQALLRRFADDPDGGLVPAHASPLAAALRTRITAVDAVAQQVGVQFEPGPEFLQAGGVVQGGAVAAMLDFAMAYAALAGIADGQSVATATLNVSFLGAARAGVLRASGTIERKGQRIVFAAARLHDADGRLVATASSALPVFDWRAPGA